jgi:hypothetical protein
MTPRQIVSEEWGRAVKEFELRPGSITETVVSRIINRLDAQIPILPCPVCGGEAIHAIDTLKRVIIKSEGGGTGQA